MSSSIVPSDQALYEQVHIQAFVMYSQQDVLTSITELFTSRLEPGSNYELILPMDAASFV